MIIWKPIEEAPKTGENMLLWDTTLTGTGLEIGHWDGVRWRTEDSEYLATLFPTHYSELNTPVEKPTVYAVMFRYEEEALKGVFADKAAAEEFIKQKYAEDYPHEVYTWEMS